MSTTLSPAQLHILQHSLGLDKHGRSTQRAFRNHFCTGLGSDDYADCQALVKLGYMYEHAPNALTGGDSYFMVTARGGLAAVKQSPPSPKLTRSQKRYRDYKGCAESFTSFIEFCRYCDQEKKEGHA